MTNNTIAAIILTLFYRRGWLFWISPRSSVIADLFGGALAGVMSSAQFFWRQPKHFLFWQFWNWFGARERNASRRQFMKRHPGLVIQPRHE